MNLTDKSVEELETMLKEQEEYIKQLYEEKGEIESKIKLLKTKLEE